MALILSILSLIVFLTLTLAVDFDECLKQIHKGTYGPSGGLDNKGNAVDIDQATAITYELCLKACNSGQEPFSWVFFSQQFAAWLLPWLALVSQLPFGANDNLQNFESAVLAIGSPMMAGYSLSLTILNSRWIVRKFEYIHWPSTNDAVKVLNWLQQAPLEITDEEGLLSSLIVLPENDPWWTYLIKYLDYTHTWSISAVTSLAWVIIAYVFTVIESFLGDVTANVNANGQAIGDLWVWLLPVVFCWLQVSPRCDSKKLCAAINKANETKLYCRSRDDADPCAILHKKKKGAISFAYHRCDDSLRQDEFCTAPIYNYARFLPWANSVEYIWLKFYYASKNADMHVSVSGGQWEQGRNNTERSRNTINDNNRYGTFEQLLVYCQEAHLKPRLCSSPTFGRMLMAIVLGLFLQWGTTGAAFVVVWFTPAIGLGCRTASYLLYGCLGTLSWFFLWISSLLTQYIVVNFQEEELRPKVLTYLAITSRWLGKMAALLNTFWILLTCFFQFSNHFDTCFCNSNAWVQKKPFITIDYQAGDVTKMKVAWAGGLVMASCTAILFVSYLRILLARDEK